MKIVKQFKQALVPLVCALAAVPAMATNVYVTVPDNYGAASVRLDNTSMNVATTTIDLSYGGNSFEAFCIELNQGLSPNSTVNYSIGSYVNDGISRLFAAAGFNGAGKNTDSISTADQRSALQLAVWEVVYDGIGNSFSTGRFQAISTSSASALGLANTYLAAAAALKAGQYTTSTLKRYSHANKQDLVSSTDLSLVPVSAVPEPETALMWLGGVAALVAAARRRRRAQSMS